jgi:hypothetical protein
MGGVIVFLLAAILCTMLFGPAPVLVILGIGVAYVILMLVAAGVGNLLGAIGRRLSQKAACTGEHLVPGPDAPSRREPFFGHPAIGPIVCVIVGAITIFQAVQYFR